MITPERQVRRQGHFDMKKPGPQTARTPPENRRSSISAVGENSAMAGAATALVITGMMGTVAATLVIIGVTTTATPTLVVVDVMIGAVIGAIFGKRRGRAGDRRNRLNDRDGSGESDGCGECSKKLGLHVDNPPVRFDRREIATRTLTEG
jgi:hypothetical protein